MRRYLQSLPEVQIVCIMNNVRDGRAHGCTALVVDYANTPNATKRLYCRLDLS